ncbi:MAG: type II toxin-antitoxin system RelE/ParE family toxin [Candidatus Aminicenantales bacterium]|jgi:mRNA interferase RelE/StbE
MERYRLLIKKSAADELAGGISRKDLEKIVRRIQGLAGDPRPSGCRKLSGQDRYRLRPGEYRVVYTVDDARRIVEVYKIDNRREIYK